MSYEIHWGRGGSFNHGRVEGTDYRCERYAVGDKANKEYWYMLADSKITYLCTKGPFNTPQERDTAIVEEVRKRELANNS